MRLDWRAVRTRLPGVLLACALLAQPAQAASILFIGNSFTFADGSAVARFHPESVTDLNAHGASGVPALFQAFARQCGLSYEVAIEAEPGKGIDWHLAHRRARIASRPWDTVVLQGFSTLDQDHPGDPARLVSSVRAMAAFLHSRNPAVDIRLMATWPRADQTYRPGGAWYGQPVAAMARDLRSGYDRAAAASPYVRAVIPVGEAWVRAMQAGIATDNPYDDGHPGQLDLWAAEGHHASRFGSYLEALVLFGGITGRDPRTLGADERSAGELGLAPEQVRALQQVAFETLAQERDAGAGPSAGSVP